MTFALGTPHRGQTIPDEERFAMHSTPIYEKIRATADYLLESSVKYAGSCVVI
jgi:hypothetical protein